MPSDRRDQPEAKPRKRIALGAVLGWGALLGIILLLFGMMAMDGLANGRLHREAELAESELFVIEGFEEVARSFGRSRILTFGHLVGTGEEFPGGISLASEERGLQAGDTVRGYLIQDEGGQRFVTEGWVNGLKPIWHLGSLYFNFLFPLAVAAMAFFVGIAYLALVVDPDEEIG